MMKMPKVTLDENTKEYLKDLANNPQLKAYQINLNNCNYFQTYLDEMDHCRGCHGLNECQNENRGRFTKIKEENGQYYFPLCSCDYYKKETNVNALKNNSAFYFLPENLMNASFDNFSLYCEARKKAMDYAISFCKACQNKTFKEGLFLSGKFGTGKTYYLACLANLLAVNNITSILVYFPDLVRELKNQMSSGNMEYLINKLKTIDVLMIDDLGSEMMTSWLRDEILGPIINYRLVENKPVFVSSNLDWNQFVDHLAETKDGSGDKAKANRICDRLSALLINTSVGEKNFRNLK